MKFEWKGIYPALTTKFDKDDNLDIKEFEKNLEAQLDAGVHGVILGGSLGEASTLTKEEKDELLKCTKSYVNGRIPTLMNIAEQSTREAVKAVQRAELNGADGLMLLPPMVYAADELETLAYFKEVARSTSLPIMLYNNPVDYKIMITLRMFEELQDFSNIQAVKESTRDISNITRMRNRFQDRFSILTGVDTLGLESLLMGADGWVAGLVCAFPKETVVIYNLVKSGRYEEALKIYRWFLPLLELDVSSKLVQNIKLAESLTGLGTEYVRLPRMALHGDERARVIQIVEKALLERPFLPEDISEDPTLIFSS
jgi:1-pyrroline-4-hydroxy-2-carboxylate deaminase